MFKFSAKDIASDYGFLLRLVSTFTIGTDEYYPMCYKWYQGPLKTLYIILSFLTNHHHMGILQNDSLYLKLYWFSAVHYHTLFEGYQQAFESKTSHSQDLGSPRKNICWYGTQKLPKTLTFVFITTKQKQLFSQLRIMKKQLWCAVT